MSGPSDYAVSTAIRELQKMIEAAENSNHAGEIATVRAAAAGALERALRLVLPEIRNSISAGDGRFTDEQVATIEEALAHARGDFLASVGRAA